MKVSEYLLKQYASGYEEHTHTSIEVHCEIGTCGVDVEILDNLFIDKKKLELSLLKLLNNFELEVKNESPNLDGVWFLTQDLKKDILYLLQKKE